MKTIKKMTKDEYLDFKSNLPDKCKPICEYMFKFIVMEDWTHYEPVWIDYEDENENYYQITHGGDDKKFEFKELYPRWYAERKMKHRCGACGEVHSLNMFRYNYYKQKWSNVCHDCEDVVKKHLTDSAPKLGDYQKMIYRWLNDGLYRFKIVEWNNGMGVLDTGEVINQDIIRRSFRTFDFRCNKCGDRITAPEQLSFKNAPKRIVGAVCKRCDDKYYSDYYLENKKKISDRRKEEYWNKK